MQGALGRLYINTPVQQVKRGIILACKANDKAKKQKNKIA